MDKLEIEYEFNFADGNQKVIKAVLDKKTLSMKAPEREEYPSWTSLENHQCASCPLNKEEYHHCPVAVNLMDIVDFFDAYNSYDQAEVTVSTKYRKYVKETSLQEGLSSLVGLHMATSGCPILDKLRPMVFTHLPFASSGETSYRAISMYLMAQFFRWKKGMKPDWQLNELVEIYQDVNEVNQHFTKRILSINDRDANLNALVRLDCFAMSVSSSIVKDSLGKFENLFHAYFNEE